MSFLNQLVIKEWKCQFGHPQAAFDKLLSASSELIVRELIMDFVMDSTLVIDCQFAKLLFRLAILAIEGESVAGYLQRYQIPSLVCSPNPSFFHAYPEYDYKVVSGLPALSMEELPANTTLFETYWYSPTVTIHAIENNSDSEHPGIHCLCVNNKQIFFDGGDRRSLRKAGVSSKPPVFDKEGVVVINSVDGIERRIQSTCLQLYGQDCGEIAMNPEDTFIYPTHA